jgi:YkoY family integral membrane protein
MWDIQFADLIAVLGTIVTLVVLEGLLSGDNALVLAVMVRHLPREEQKRALRYGIWGAFGFRLIAVLLSSFLLQFWLFKVVGGVYLLYLALSHFASCEEHVHSNKTTRFGSGFWGTVVSVELADIAFSIDSIVAAVAMSDSMPARFGANGRLFIVYIGGILGIITMRFVAGLFILLLERFHGLAVGAYILVAWIGLKLVWSGLHNAQYLPGEMAEWLFWSGMLVIVVASMLYKPRGVPSPRPKKGPDATAEVGAGGPLAPPHDGSHAVEPGAAEPRVATARSAPAAARGAAAGPEG